MRRSPQYGTGRGAGRLPVLEVCLGLFACVALVVPSQAAGHAGEVHPEPTPAAEKPVDPGSAVGKSSGGGGSPRQDSGGRQAGGSPSAVVDDEQTETSAPPVPEVPESNPTAHFLVLGALALLGGGAILLLRRRNALG